MCCRYLIPRLPCCPPPLPPTLRGPVVLNGFSGALQPKLSSSNTGTSINYSPSRSLPPSFRPSPSPPPPPPKCSLGTNIPSTLLVPLPILVAVMVQTCHSTHSSCGSPRAHTCLPLLPLAPPPLSTPYIFFLYQPPLLTCTHSQQPCSRHSRSQAGHCCRQSSGSNGGWLHCCPVLVYHKAQGCEGDTQGGTQHVTCTKHLLWGGGDGIQTGGRGRECFKHKWWWWWRGWAGREGGGQKEVKVLAIGCSGQSRLACQKPKPECW